MQSQTNDFILKVMIFSPNQNWIKMFNLACDLVDMKSTKKTMLTFMAASKHSLLMRKQMKYMAVLTLEEMGFGKSLKTNKNSRRKISVKIDTRHNTFLITCYSITIYDSNLLISYPILL